MSRQAGSSRLEQANVDTPSAVLLALSTGFKVDIITPILKRGPWGLMSDGTYPGQTAQE